MHSLRTIVLIAVLLFSPPTHAFFDVLDALQRELEQQPIGTTPLHLQDLMNTLSTSTTTPYSFKDVDTFAWYADYVHAAARWGIVSGYRDSQGQLLGQFGPSDPVTIAEILKMAIKAAGIDEKTCSASPLHPQARNHWSKLFVSCAEERHFRILTPSPTLDRPALRGEVLTIVHDAFKDIIPPLLSSFKDTAYHPYEADIAFASILGIVSGDKDELGRALGTFRPNDRVNRAEAAKILYEKLRVKMSDEIAKAQGVLPPPPVTP